MILPYPWAIMWRPSAWQHRNNPRRFRSNVASHSSMAVSSAAELKLMPALLTAMCSPPKRSRVAASIPLISEASVTSLRTAATSRPAATISSAVRWAPSPLMSEIITEAPAWASDKA